VGPAAVTTITTDFILLTAERNASYTESGFDPRDFSGVWERDSGDRGFGPEDTIPRLTPAGEEKAAHMLSPGRSRLPEIIKNVDRPELSNDPTFSCNPTGFPRLILDFAHDYHEWHHLPDRMMQVYQESRVLREIWMDGREVPSAEDIDNLGPMWYGHSVGRWEEDTLVITTVGLDARALLDSFLLPKSFNARIEERYRRVDADTLELQLTLSDPDYYSETWVSDVKTWTRVPRENMTFYGWYGMLSGLGELICAPMNAGGTNARGG
jgi:hypothetical protein